MRMMFISGALAALIGPPAMAQEDAPPPRVRLAAVELQAMAPTIAVPATVASRHDSDIASEASGRITFVAEAGDIIEEGEPVARIDEAELRLRLEEAEARVARLEVSLAQQSRDVARREELASRGTLAESELDEVASRRDMTALELREARIAVERAQVDLARATVMAPFTGLVVERLVEVGEYATPGGDIARLVDLQALEARGQAPVSVAQYVRQGDAIEVEGDAATLDAPISAVIAAGDSLTRTFEVRVDLTDADWIIGAPVRLHVPSDVAREEICVPRDALLLRSDGAYVMLVDEENVAHRVAVTPGAGSGEWVAVGDTLTVGDRVVVRGAERLRDGQTVEPLDVAAMIAPRADRSADDEGGRT